jgi:small GTP-binding protein
VALNYNDEELTINIWDTAGQERFRSLVPLYTRGADLIVLVFSLADVTSFDHLESWYSKVRVDMHLTCPLVLCGNKTDLAEQVPRSRAIEWATDHGCPLVFTSAVTGDNVKELFRIVAQEIWKASNRISVMERPSGATIPIPTESSKSCC